MARCWLGSLAVLLLLALGPTNGLAAMSMGGAPITQTGKTAHFRLMLQIGPMETMYSKADAAKMHPTTGEIMVGGAMAMSGGAMIGQTGAMTTDTRHLEVHVASLATGKVTTDATCQITVTNEATKASQVVPIAMMYGVKEGTSDWHYGNNVSMAPGSYTVKVVVNGEPALFHVTIPKS
ncbi:MAG TPA: hypothetical protein VKZ50_00225 [bacterium]|nr:hypothetical protein [bacterium]